MTVKLETRFRCASSNELFLSRVALVYPRSSRTFRRIVRAINVLEVVFKDHYRANGDQSIVHHRAVFLYLLERFHTVRDVDVLIAGLLHDVIEDIPGWTRSRIAHLFNGRVAALVASVTKDKISLHANNKIVRDEKFRNKLQKGSRPVACIKNADRTHNVHTLKHVSRERQVKTVRETEVFYYPLAQKWMIPLSELKHAVGRIKKGWDRRH